MQFTIANVAPGEAVIWLHFFLVFATIFWAMFLLRCVCPPPAASSSFPAFPSRPWTLRAALPRPLIPALPRRRRLSFDIYAL